MFSLSRRSISGQNFLRRPHSNITSTSLLSAAQRRHSSSSNSSSSIIAKNNSCCSSAATQQPSSSSSPSPSPYSSMRHCASSSSSAKPSSTADFEMPKFQGNGSSDFPVIQLPCESLWFKQSPVSLSDLKSPEFRRMLEKLKATRKHYQYPAMSAPQIGWNVQVFTLYDDSVWINPTVEKLFQDNMCWTWEPCASCCFLMHYIERPHEGVVSYYDEKGVFHEKVKVDGMRSRLVQHEMDHMNGVLFTRRIPDALHVVPLDGFNTMSDWSEDYPSIEARSTNLFTLYFPPLKMVAHGLQDSELLARHYEDNIFPGHEIIRKANEEEKTNAATLHDFIECQKAAGLWEGSQFSRTRKEQQQRQQKEQEEQQEQS